MAEFGVAVCGQVGLAGQTAGPKAERQAGAGVCLLIAAPDAAGQPPKEE